MLQSLIKKTKQFKKELCFDDESQDSLKNWDIFRVSQTFPGSRESEIAGRNRCNRPEYTPGRIIPRVNAAYRLDYTRVCLYYDIGQLIPKVYYGL